MKFWTEREPREKMLIGIALGLLALIFGTQFIVKPLMAYPDKPVSYTHLTLPTIYSV